MTVYIDVLLIVNIYIDFFILKITGKLLRIKIKAYRYVISAFIGSFSSLFIFLPKMNIFLNLFCMMIFAAGMVFIAFGKCRIGEFMKRTFVLFFVNFTLSGVVGLISSKVNFILFKNFILYADISIITLIFSTTAAYFIISIFQYIHIRKNTLNTDFDIFLKYNDQTVFFKALGDTGNLLIDSISGKPVIVCNNNFLPINYEFKSRLKDLRSDNIAEFLMDKNKPKGFKIIPFNTINSSGLLPVFMPDEIIIKNGVDKYENIDALIGISEVNNKDYNAIFNPKILI